MVAFKWLLLIFSLHKTPLREPGCLVNPYFFAYWLFRHPVSCFTSFATQSVRLPLVTYPSLCSICLIPLLFEDCKVSINISLYPSVPNCIREIPDHLKAQEICAKSVRRKCKGLAVSIM